MSNGRTGFGATTVTAGSPKTNKATKKSNDRHGQKKTPYGNKILNNFLHSYAKDPKQMDKLIFSSEFMAGEQKRLRWFVGNRFRHR